MSSYTNSPFWKYLGPEAKEHMRLCEWLSWTKPGLWFHYPAEGKKTPFEQWLWKNMGGKKSVADFMFLDAMGKYKGLAIELKATGTVIMNQNGTPRKAVEDQWEFLKELEKRGWKATFAVGYEEAQKIIKDYYDQADYYEPDYSEGN